MENMVFEGIITATSKKQSADFKQEIPTKTAYIKADAANAEKLVDFGLQKYTSKDEGEDYFILKTVAKLMVYYPNGLGEQRPDLSHVTFEGQETNNFKTPDNLPIKMNVIKGNHKNNDFFRLQAIRVASAEDIEEIEPENPFGDDVAF